MLLVWYTHTHTHTYKQQQQRSGKQQKEPLAELMIHPLFLVFYVEKSGSWDVGRVM